MAHPIITQLQRYLGFHAGEANTTATLASLFDQAALQADLCDRKAAPGHVTGSGIVISDMRVLLIHHRALNRWLQPGGHIEEGESPLEAALREVEEETGVRAVAHPWHDSHPFPFDVDVHGIPANPAKPEPAHLHYDFRYLLVPLTEAAGPAECEFRWAPATEFADCGTGAARIVAKLEHEIFNSPARA